MGSNPVGGLRKFVFLCIRLENSSSFISLDLSHHFTYHLNILTYAGGGGRRNGWNPRPSTVKLEHRAQVFSLLRTLILTNGDRFSLKHLCNPASPLLLLFNERLNFV